MKKRNSFTVVFLTHNLLTLYMVVCKFLAFPATSHSVDIAIVRCLEVSTCRILEQLALPPELQSFASLLSSDFVSVRNEGQTLAIPVEHIYFKCFDISTRDISAITTLLSI